MGQALLGNQWRDATIPCGDTWREWSTMSTHKHTTSTTMPLVAAALTVVLALGAIAVVAFDRLEIARGRKIEEAAQIPLTLPLVSGGLLLVAAGWLYWLIRKYGPKHIVSIIVAGATIILLIATPLFAWQSFTSERDLTVLSMTCDAESLRNTGRSTLADCEDNAVETIVLLEGVKNGDQWVPSTITDNLTRQFHALPGGDWETTLTVDGPPETVAVSVVGERDDEHVRLGNMRPYMDASTGRLRWSAVVPVDADVSTLRVLFYLSAHPGVESASIRFEVQECSGQNIRSFDASQCAPLEASAPFVMEKTPSEPRTWRHPHVTRDGSDIVITNLEARTYELQPDYASIQTYTQSTDVLIIPSAMPQIADNSIVEPGADTFEVTTESNSAELVYTIYVFPSGPTFASVSEQHQ